MRKLIAIIALTISYLGVTAVASAYQPMPTCGVTTTCTVR